MVSIGINTITDNGKSLMHLWVQYATNIALRIRFRTVFKPHPEYKQPISKLVEKEHIKLWRNLRNDINLDTLRICCHVSGKENPKMVPEEVFESEIQRSLCRKHKEIKFMANKSFYNRWFQNNIFPKSFFHNIEGVFYNSQYQVLLDSEILNAFNHIEYPVVLKPNTDSVGGANVFFVKSKDELINLIKGKKNYVIQEQIQQDEFFAKYNRYCLNTIRVDLYRSVKTNKVHYLHSSFRMGKGGSLDNETAGGIHCFINEDGYLNDYAVDKVETKYFKHPDTNFEFSKETKLPAFEDMKRVAVKVAQDLFLPRLVSLDMCLDLHGQWRVIEINLLDLTIQFAQLGGKPFFEPFTEEVIDYCKKNPWWK